VTIIFLSIISTYSSFRFLFWSWLGVVEFAIEYFDSEEMNAKKSVTLVLVMMKNLKSFVKAVKVGTIFFSFTG